MKNGLLTTLRNVCTQQGFGVPWKDQLRVGREPLTRGVSGNTILDNLRSSYNTVCGVVVVMNQTHGNVSDAGSTDHAVVGKNPTGRVVVG